MATYKIIRFYQDEVSRTIYQGLSLEEAQAHCNNPLTHGGLVEHGTAWFDGYEEDVQTNDHDDCAYCAAGEASEHNPEILDPDEWVCSHYQRKDFPVYGESEAEHLGHCYVDYPGSEGY